MVNLLEDCKKYDYQFQLKKEKIMYNLDLQVMSHDYCIHMYLADIRFIIYHPLLKFLHNPQKQKTINSVM